MFREGEQLWLGGFPYDNRRPEKSWYPYSKLSNLEDLGGVLQRRATRNWFFGLACLQHTSGISPALDVPACARLSATGPCPCAAALER